MQHKRGFTLVEMSIVLVIIGLVIGGVLVGKDLIKVAEIRGTISEIEKYQTAANTFKGKYGTLPGDMSAEHAAQFGFGLRYDFAGQGDENGLIEGVDANGPGRNVGIYQSSGETTMFWADLQSAGLIAGDFSAGIANAGQAQYTGNITLTQLSGYIPPSHMGRGNFVYVWSGGIGSPWYSYGTDHNNYFSISAAYSIIAGWELLSHPGFTSLEANAIDSKIDDGLPQTGRVTAMYLNEYANWSPNQSYYLEPAHTACTSWSNNAYDLASAPNDINCGVSFQFQ